MRWLASLAIGQLLLVTVVVVLQVVLQVMATGETTASTDYTAPYHCSKLPRGTQCRGRERRSDLQLAPISGANHNYYLMVDMINKSSSRHSDPLDGFHLEGTAATRSNTRSQQRPHSQLFHQQPQHTIPLYGQCRHQSAFQFMLILCTMTQ